MQTLGLRTSMSLLRLFKTYSWPFHLHDATPECGAYRFICSHPSVQSRTIEVFESFVYIRGAQPRCSKAIDT